MKTLELKKNFYWVGSLDPGLRVFDIIMHTEFGTTYGSYLLRGSEKTVLFETAKAKCKDAYLEQLSSIVDPKEIDYIVVSHTEPDHSGTIVDLLKINPAIKIVGTGTALRFVKEIVNEDFNKIAVKDGDTLSIGDKTLRFFTAANLHWPDAMYTYVEEDKVLVTCDSFGCHYSFPDVLISKLADREGYNRALRYYYDNIMGPFKPYVLKAIDKIKDLEINMICPGHGPVLDEDPWKIVNIYKEWSTETNPNNKKTVVIPYVSAYGYTEELATEIKKGIEAAGDIDVRLYDMVTADVTEVLGEIYWADGILFGTPTIIGEALKPIWDLTTCMFAPIHGGKIASAFGSYGWSGEGVPHIMERLHQLRMKVYGEGLRFPFRPSKAQLATAYEFGAGFGISVLAGKVTEGKEEFTGKRYWKCLVCGEIVEGAQPPESCPVCGVGPDQFIQIQVDEVTYRSDTQETFLILGGGIAGLSAAEEIRKRNSSATVEIISDEEVLCYNRPMLTKGILSEPDGINFFTKQLDWYESNRIDFTLGKAVAAIDIKSKEVTLEGGVKKHYDKLVYAVGAECNKPSIPGSDGINVFHIRRLADANGFRERLGGAASVAIIGGGILGLEAAWECRRAGKDVTVIEMADGLMQSQLDEKGAALLREAVEESGVTVSCGGGIKEIGASSVVMTDGTEVAADIVILSAGIKPNTALGVSAGLKGDRWIETDNKMKTSDVNVYAAGDVAAVDGVSVGIWNQALEMGKVAGANATGDEVIYKPVTPSNAFSGFGVEIYSIGDNGKKTNLKYKEVEFSEKAKGIYKKMYFVNDKFVGGILIGAQELGPKMLEAYEKKRSLKDCIGLL